MGGLSQTFTKGKASLIREQGEMIALSHMHLQASGLGGWPGGRMHTQSEALHCVLFSLQPLPFNKQQPSNVHVSGKGTPITSVKLNPKWKVSKMFVRTPSCWYSLWFCFALWNAFCSAFFVASLFLDSFIFVWEVFPTSSSALYWVASIIHDLHALQKQFYVPVLPNYLDF